MRMANLSAMSSTLPSTAQPAARANSPLSLREATPTSQRVSLRDIVASIRVARIVGARDIKVKYKQSALGPLWLVIQPLGLLAAITVAFSGVTKVNTGGVPYLLFGLVGICVWNFIAMTLSVAPQAFVSNSTLVRRSPAPRPAFITATVMGNLPLLGIMLSVALIGSLIWRGPALEMLALPALVAWLLLFAWATVVLIAPIASRFRDAIAIVPLLVQAGMFISPVGYDLATAPSNIKIVLSINPVTGIIEAWRWCLLGMDASIGIVAVGLAWTVVLLLVGWRIFVRMEYRLADFV
jgi:homopolymeric O-antigen transport system permease protein